jgi:MFS family permease
MARWQFFEPYLWVVLVNWGVSLTRIGLLISLQKVVCYGEWGAIDLFTSERASLCTHPRITAVFELPSGLLADRWGMRKELCLCFVFYIASFGFYYMGRVHFGFLLVASFCYGMGEAMRSGTHKAMVVLWLERHDLLQCKSYLYGKTRSYSLLGSAVSSVASIFVMMLVTGQNAQENIFLWSVIPYVLDLLVVASYPDYMDSGSAEPESTDASKWWLQPVADIKAVGVVFADPARRRCLLSSCSFMSYHDVLKHFIQAIVLLYGAVGLGYTNWDGHEKQQTVLLGVTYAVFYAVSTPVTKNAYRIQKLFARCWADHNSVLPRPRVPHSFIHSRTC